MGGESPVGDPAAPAVARGLVLSAPGRQGRTRPHGSPAPCSSRRCCWGATGPAPSSRCVTSVRTSAYAAQLGAFDGTELECVAITALALRQRRALHCADPHLGPGPGLRSRLASRSPAIWREVEGNIWVFAASASARHPRRPTSGARHPFARRAGFFAESVAPDESSRPCAFAAPIDHARRRADGPGARTLCAPRVVVAVAPLGARKGQGVRALALCGSPR